MVPWLLRSLLFAQFAPKSEATKVAQFIGHSAPFNKEDKVLVKSVH